MFSANIIWLTGLVEIELHDRTLRLCDGGVVNWPGIGLFVAKDDVYGTIGGVENQMETLGADEVPDGSFSMLCPGHEAMITMASPLNQGRAVRFWIAECDAAGNIVGSPELQFTGLIDTLEAEFGQNEFSVALNYMSDAERLFFIEEGNILSSRFHQTAWPGELGFDFCTGAQIAVPWGVAGPPRGATGGGGGSIGGGGGGVGFSRALGVWANSQ